MREKERERERERCSKAEDGGWKGWMKSEMWRTKKDRNRSVLLYQPLPFFLVVYIGHTQPIATEYFAFTHFACMSFLIAALNETMTRSSWIKRTNKSKEEAEKAVFVILFNCMEHTNHILFFFFVFGDNSISFFNFVGRRGNGTGNGKSYEKQPHSIPTHVARLQADWKWWQSKLTKHTRTCTLAPSWLLNCIDHGWTTITCSLVTE